MPVGDEEFNLLLFEAPGNEDFDRIRPTLYYPKVVIFIFNIFYR